MRAICSACALLLCAATAHAQAPEPADLEESPEQPEPIADEPVIAGETIEISSEAPLDPAAGAPEQVTREEVRTLPGARGDAIEGVRNLPGIAFASSYNGGAGDLLVRGTDTSDSWYLIDGVPIPLSMHFGNVTTVVPLEMIESIEFSPGGFTGDIGTRDRFWRTIATWRYDGEHIDSRATISYGGDLETLDLNDTHSLDIRLRDVTAREDLAIPLGSRLKLRTGGDVHAIQGAVAARLPAGGGDGAPDPNLTLDPVIDLDETITDVQSAGYAALDVRPLSRLTITSGVRVDHYSRIDDLVVQPRTSAELDLGRGWVTRTSLGRFSRPHSGAESVSTALEAETAIQATAGVEKRFGDTLRVQATMFSTWLDDLAVYDPSIMTGDPVDSYVSRGTGTARGAELLVRVRRSDLFGWLAYTYTRSRRTDGPDMRERLFDFDQPHNLVAAASWAIGAWQLGGRFRLASGPPHTPVIGSIYMADHDLYRPIYGPTNSDRLDAPHQLDLRLDRRFQLGDWKLSAYLDVSNVYANPRVLDYAYDFEYREREPITDLPFLPSIGLRGEY